MEFDFSIPTNLVKLSMAKSGWSIVLSGPEVTRMVNDAAGRVAAEVYEKLGYHVLNATVSVQPYQTKRMIGQRSAAQVIVACSGAFAVCKKYGGLVAAAKAAGLPVKKRR